MDVTFHGPVALANELASALRNEGLHVVYNVPDEDDDSRSRVIVLAVFGETTDASLHVTTERAVAGFRDAHPEILATVPAFTAPSPEVNVR